MKVGDLVRLVSENELGIIIDINIEKTDDPLDVMFPYNIHFVKLPNDDWFGIKSLELISESR